MLIKNQTISQEIVFGMSDADFSFFQLVWSSRIESEKLDWIVFFANDITIKVRVLRREHIYMNSLFLFRWNEIIGIKVVKCMK